MGLPRRPRRLRSRRRCLLRTPSARCNFVLFAAFVLNLPAMLPQGPPSYHPDCEAAVNVQIWLQLYASYVYLSMAVYCNRSNVAQSHFSSLFLRRSHQWREGAEKLMWMQNARGGHVILRSITEPESMDWRGSAQAVACAFHLESTLKQSLLLLHRVAADKNDSDLCAFVLSHYLNPQVPVLRELGEYLTNFRETGTLSEDLVSNLLRRLSLDDTDGKN